MEQELLNYGLKATCDIYKCPITKKGLPNKNYRFGKNICDSIDKLLDMGIQVRI